MTNQVNLESAQPVSGTPTPNGVQGAGSGQPPSTGVVTFTAEQWAEVEKLVERKAQSIKDRRFQELENSVNALRNTPAQAPVQPTPPSQVQAPSSANGGSQPASQPIDYLAPLKVVGLDASDGEVLSLMVKHKGDQVAFNAALVDLKAKRLNQPPAPASAITAPSGSVSSGNTLDADIARLAELQRNPRQNKAEMDALLQRIDASGALR